MEKTLIDEKRFGERIFQIGSLFPIISGSSICLNGKEEFRRLEIAGIKRRIKNYLGLHKKVRISDLAEIFDISPRLIGQALNELEKEGIIKESE